MEYNEQIRNANTLDELFELWKNKHPEGGIDHKNNVFISDGIVNPQVWNSRSRKRILFILKEAYGDDWKTNTLATWIAREHPTRRIWNRIARMVYGIQNTSTTEICAYKPHLSRDEHVSALDQIAVLNLKKSNGKSWSNYDEILKYAEYDREEIKREFELIDADIIICGSTFTAFYERVYEKTIPVSEKSDNWFYWLEVGGRKRLFIDFYHPANRWPNLLNYYALQGIYQQALLSEDL